MASADNQGDPAAVVPPRDVPDDRARVAASGEAPTRSVRAVWPVVRARVGRSMTGLDEIWKDQGAFNDRLRPFPHAYEDKCDATSRLVLELTDELHELLRTTVWKKHRNNDRLRPNIAHTTEELVDVFKYFITLCQTWDVSPERLLEGYWQKSAVCEQRYVEEWVSAYAKKNPLGRVAFVDLDNVIFDYVRSFGAFLTERAPWRAAGHMRDRLTSLLERREWLSAVSVGVHPQEWAKLQHEYRTSGASAWMPVMPGAAHFLAAVRAAGFVIIIVTSRPMAAAPNLYTETVANLHRHGLVFDHLWFGHSKKEELLERLGDVYNWAEHAIAVDDDPRYIQEYVSMNVPAYHVINGAANLATPTGGRRVETLMDIVPDLAKYFGT
ncbi:MAG: hypothetical protein E6R03_00115 [Hyphomicrobiaceae bacterium]|nr:MAG: hypothetical protein E6R03_00115 [Hyphomicrobiaceae bacterium]